MGWFTEWWSGFGAKIKAFFAGPGGDILKQFAANLVRAAGTQGAALLMTAAQNQVAGRPALSTEDWRQAGLNLQRYAIAEGIPTTIGFIDAAIGAAVAASPQPSATVLQRYE